MRPAALGVATRSRRARRDGNHTAPHSGAGGTAVRSRCAVTIHGIPLAQAGISNDQVQVSTLCKRSVPAIISLPCKPGHRGPAIHHTWTRHLEKILFFMLATLTLAAWPSARAASIDAAQHGARGDGKTLNTRAIQRAIDAATPGDKVTFPPS